VQPTIAERVASARTSAARRPVSNKAETRATRRAPPEWPQAIVPDTAMMAIGTRNRPAVKAARRVLLSTI
jgi:hypothetical protein